MTTDKNHGSSRDSRYIRIQYLLLEELGVIKTFFRICTHIAIEAKGLCDGKFNVMSHSMRSKSKGLYFFKKGKNENPTYLMKVVAFKSPSAQFESMLCSGCAQSGNSCKNSSIKYLDTSMVFRVMWNIY